MPLILIAGAALLGAFGFAVDQTGDAVEQSSNTLIKVALVGGAAYLVAKKMKVI